MQTEAVKRGEQSPADASFAARPVCSREAGLGTRGGVIPGCFVDQAADTPIFLSCWAGTCRAEAGAGVALRRRCCGLSGRYCKAREGDAGILLSSHPAKRLGHGGAGGADAGADHGGPGLWERHRVFPYRPALRPEASLQRGHPEGEHEQEDR